MYELGGSVWLYGDDVLHVCNQSSKQQHLQETTDNKIWGITCILTMAYIVDL